MTAAELIKELEKYDGNTDVLYFNSHTETYCTADVAWKDTEGVKIV